jgi:hypothetical protein
MDTQPAPPADQPDHPIANIRLPDSLRNREWASKRRYGTCNRSLLRKHPSPDRGTRLLGIRSRYCLHKCPDTRQGRTRRNWVHSSRSPDRSRNCCCCTWNFRTTNDFRSILY